MYIIKIILGITVSYSFIMWFVWAGFALAHRKRLNAIELDRIATFTFRVGLTGILAAGFLGLLLKGS